MSRWREVARQLKEQGGVREDEGQRGKAAAPADIVPPAAIAPEAVPASPCASPEDWARELARMDLDQPPKGMGRDRWAAYLEDARWLVVRHGAAALSLGWTASDLFGFDGRDGWGGLADRLDGARRVILSDGVARWRNDECDGWLWRRTLAERPPIWAYVQKGGARG